MLKGMMLTLVFPLISSVMVMAQMEFPYEVSAANAYGQPHPEAPEALKDFAPMIGQRVCVSQNRNPDGTWQDTVHMYWTFKYIMNGMAIQDETLKEDGAHAGSIRQYDPDSSRWYVHYYSSNSPSGSLPFWTGKKEEGKIVLYRPQKAPNGMDGDSRLTFYNMSKNGYDWVGEWVSQDRTIAYPFWRISCKRKE